jgi:hypothetical protein
MPERTGSDQLPATDNNRSLSVGEGEDAHGLPDKVETMFRHWALDWLRDDLTAYTGLAAQNNPDRKQAIQQRLAHWRDDRAAKARANAV